MEASHEIRAGRIELMPGPLAPQQVSPQTAPNALPIVPSLADKVVSAGMYGSNTAMVTAAPMMNTFLPGANPSGAGGLEVSLIGDGILVIVQALQVHKWFNRDKWGIWVIIALSLVMCLFIWRDSELQRGVLNACGAAWKAFGSYGALNKLGVLGPITDDT